MKKILLTVLGLLLCANAYAGQTLHANLTGSDLHQPFVVGVNASKNATPDIGDFYFANDTNTTYICQVDNAWTQYHPPTGTTSFTMTGDLTVVNITASGWVNATGDIISSANMTADFFIGNGSQLTGIATGGDMNYSDIRYKVGNITSPGDLGSSGAESNVSYTSVGFQPKSIEFMSIYQAVGGDASTYSLSSGFSDGTNNRVIYSYGNHTDSKINYTECIHIGYSSDFSGGYIQSFDADGFTIHWYQTGSTGAPAAQNIIYKAER